MREKFACDFLGGPRRCTDDPRHITAGDFSAEEDFPKHEGRAAGKFLRGLAALPVTDDPVQHALDRQEFLHELHLIHSCSQKELAEFSEVAL